METLILMFALLVMAAIVTRFHLLTGMGLQGDVKFASGEVRDLTLGSASVADDILNAVGDVFSPNLPNETVTFSGDIDTEDSELDDDELLGAARRKTNSSKVRQSNDKFPRNFLRDKVTEGVVKAKGVTQKTPDQVKQIDTLSKVPGGLMQQASFPPLNIIGGRIKRAATTLKLDGKNFYFALQVWMAQHPGLSTIGSALSTGATITFTVVAISAPYVSYVLPTILTFTANDLNRIRGSQVALTFAGQRSDGTAMSVTGDLIEIFTGDSVKTVVCFIPYLIVKQRLHAIPIVPAANPNEYIITLVGVPSGTQVVYSLAGDDDLDWNDFQNMVNM